MITRAVGPITETLDRVASCLSAGGRMIFMKGPGCDLEVAEAVKTRGEAFRLAADHAYSIPGTTHDGGWSSSNAWRLSDPRAARRDRPQPVSRPGRAVRRLRSRDHEHGQSDVPALPRCLDRARHPQARRGDIERIADPRRGAGPVPRSRGRLVDRAGGPAAAGRFDHVNGSDSARRSSNSSTSWARTALCFW